MALDLKFEPFFDDYSEDSKFHRILFRPGYAVQARELTQLQTILQEQIRRHGDHVFKEGSMVIPGQISYDLDLDYVKLTFAAGVSASTIVSTLVGKEVTNSSGLIAKVIQYSLAENATEIVNGVATTIAQPYTIFVKYQNSIQDINGNNISTFTPGDLLAPVDGSVGLDVTVTDEIVGAYPPIGKGCSATIQRGIYYIKKNFVLVDDQTIILDKYTNSPTYRVGLKLNESVVYPEANESLLDNALGSPNYAAPGAARYYMDLVLSKLSLTSAADEDFIDLLRLQDSRVIFKIDRTTYAELEKTLARRTYDESGDYTLSPFNIQVKDYRNNLRGDWSAGEKFIQGDLIKVPNGINFLYFVAVTSGVSGSTRPTFSASADSVTDNQISWEYVAYPSFNQGVTTFTAGDSTYSSFTLNDHIRLYGMSALGVEAGKAYVRGYEIEKLAMEYLPIQKSRNLPAGSTALCTYFGLDADSLPAVTDSVSLPKTTSIDVSMSSYIIVNNIKYVPNLTSLASVNLHNAMYASASTGTIIGTAKIRALEKHDDAGAYKLFLFDVKMNSGKDFATTKSIYTTATTFKADAVQIDGSTIIQGNGDVSLIFALPDYAIADISEMSYSVVVPITSTATSTSLSMSVPLGYTFESINDADNYIVTDNTNNGNIVTPTLSTNLASTVLTLAGVTLGHSYTVLATIRRSDAANAEAKVTVTDAPPMALTSKTSATAQTIALNHSYVTRIVSVLMSTANGGAGTWDTTPVYSVDITNRYSFDTGQDSSKIGLSNIILVPEADAPIGPILIKYEYLAFTENTAGDILAVNSYTHATSKMRYDQIGVVSQYPLRDSIDFRPHMVGSSYQTHYFPKFGTTASIKYTNHLTRIDTVSLTSTGEYLVSRGVPSENPKTPSTPNNSMKLAHVSVEPYTFSRNDQNGIAVSRVENKRYTMRDIGKLERRIQDLEYYTALSLTELETKNLRIVDAQGFERYQNGFLVDSFDGQGVGNASSDDWYCAIDSNKKELRPFFSQKQVNLLENVNALTKNYKVSGDLVTLPFTEVELVKQTKASLTENLNPYALYSWKGIVAINPWSDTWFSTHQRPDIILNDEGQYNAIVAKANADGILGTVWNSWQTAFSSTKSLGSRLEQLGAWSTANNEILNATNNGGSFWRNRATFTAEEMVSIGGVPGNLSTGVAGSRVLTIETSAVETTSKRAGTRSFVVDKVDSRVVEDRVVDTQIVPYIRPRAVLYTGFGFKPSTALYAFFDNINVNEYITSATRLEVVPVAKGTGQYPYTFDVERNAGSAVQNVERTVQFSDGVSVSGTVTLTNGSNTVTGVATAFLQQIEVGDFLNIGTTTRYKVTAIATNYSLTIGTPYVGTTSDGVSIKVIGPRHTTEDVEIAFNHGEVLKEVNGNGNTAIVVAQERSGISYFIYVLNIKGSGAFSTASTAYLEGEYLTTTGDKPRVKFIARTDYSTVQTTQTGLLAGIFRIPSNPVIKFRTGTRELRFSDSASSSQATRAATESTGSSSFYEANGLIEIKQRTIVATRTANIVSTQVSDTNTIVTTNDRLTRDTGWYDPLAQTFMVQQEGGAFITSADLYFSTTDSKVPMRIEVREVVNGYPGTAVLPFSRVEKKPSEIITSTNASVATKFKFSSPVFLQNGVEYALVALSDSNNYRIWISQTDTIDVQTNTRISSQPYNGVLFKSQNGSAWTADQTQDMKFTIRCAEFAQTPVSIELIPPKLGYTNLGFNPFNFITGSKRCRVEHPNHGMVAGEVVIFKTRQIIDSINGIPSTEIFNVNHTIISAELDAYVIEFPTTASTAAGRVGGSYITASENFEFETAMIDIAEIVPPGTSISYQAKVINHLDQISYYSMMPKENVAFEEVKVYPSTVNYTSSEFPSGLSVIATMTPSASAKTVSPVIDLGRLAMTVVSNKIDSPDLSINDNELDIWEIGTGVKIAVGEALQLIDSNEDTVLDTLVVNSIDQPVLFENMNNNLKSGDVLRLTYSGITDAVRNMVIVEKTQDDTGNLYFLLEGFSSELALETTSGQTVDIVWLSHFKSEYAANAGSTHSKYVTKKINFSRPSEMLKIMFSAIIPTEADVEIYYKTGLSVSGDFIASRYYKATPSSYTKSTSEFSEIVADVEGLQPFDSVIIKLVMKSINKSQVPRIQDFRVIACAA